MSVKTREAVTPDAVEVPVYTADGSEQGTQAFAAGPVSNFPNVPLLKEAVRRIQGRQRQGTVKTKGRAEIKGSNKKPWRQKGTGRARSGSRKSPIWRGGGTIFGPTPRDYDYGLPKKQRKLAIRHALLTKLLDGEAAIVESVDGGKINTKSMATVLSKIGGRRRLLLGLPDGMAKSEVDQILLSCRNLPRIEILPVKDFNVLSLLKCGRLLLTRAAFDQVQEREQAHAEAS
ncbi:MAG: 50S ribosomal protein L4 [Planctomycetota bacterium]